MNGPDPILIGVAVVVGLYTFFIVPLWILLDTSPHDPRRYFWVLMGFLPLFGVGAYGFKHRRGAAFLHVLISLVMLGGLFVMAYQGVIPAEDNSLAREWQSIPKSPLTPFNAAEMRSSAPAEVTGGDIIREEDGRKILLEEEFTLSGYRLGNSTSDIIFRPESTSKSYRSFQVPGDDALLLNWDLTQFKIAFFLKYREGWGNETVAALFMPGDRLTKGMTKIGRHGGYVAEVTLVDFEVEQVPQVQFAPDDLVDAFKTVTLKILLYHSTSGPVVR